MNRNWIIGIVIAVVVLACADPSAPAARTPFFQSVSAGPSQTCAVARDGAAYCWGSNRFGGLGDGTTEPSAVPVRVRVAGWAFDSITTGWDFACALDRRGVACHFAVPLGIADRGQADDPRPPAVGRASALRGL